MKPLIIILIANLFFTSCGIYSFTGASIPSEAKSVSVKYFTSKTNNAPASLNQTITEALKEIILSQTNLMIEEISEELIFTGEITEYKIKPIAIQANETAGKNRLTISLYVKYKNNYVKEQSFESKFSRYRDFNSSENLVDVEAILIEEITTEITEDIFNKAFVNW
tara:strand:- start:152 stop:649 length:498 start_codon:yes stop_codon:yes gene_type:complete